MRTTKIWPVVVSLSAVVVACAHDDKKNTIAPQPYEARAPAIAPLPPQYIVADPQGSHATTIALSLGASGAFGLVVDKRRVVVGRGEARVSNDFTAEPIIGVSRLPSRFGGGFVFWTANTIYRADSFDNQLAPIAQIPDTIETISFAPRSLLVRSHNGERWGLGLPKGERVAILPLGVADVQALDDGRAVGFNDQGAVFTSVDNGAHWVDATTQVKSSPAKVSIIGGELWLVETGGGASRLEHDGQLSWFDKPPPEVLPELRPKDSRWRGDVAPLRVAFHSGAAIDDRTAVVIDSGDVVRIDLQTGEVLSSVPGRLPPDAQCEAVPTSGDVLFACASRAANGSAFVVSHTLSSEPSTVEQTFVGGAQFYASDDGGLAYGASCSSSGPQPALGPGVCVRLPGGRWEDRDLSTFSSDAGPSDVNVARWVPRADGRVVAIVLEPTMGVYDPQNASFVTLPPEAREAIGKGAYAPSPGGKGRIRMKRGAGGGIVDTSWSLSPGGTLRGWQRHGESIELSEDGKLVRSPFAFDVIFSGANGLGRSKDGRLYQSTDHGASWTEVATPPAGIQSADLVACTSAGCDLGAFYRTGWSGRPPHVEPAKVPAPPAAAVRRSRGLELSCRPSGAVAARTLPRTGNSPEDLGMGMSRLPSANEKTDWSYIRNMVARSIVSPIRDVASLTGGDGDNSPALRGALSGFGTSRDGDVITVMGPNKSAFGLRRGFAYAPPFDPSGRIVRTSIGMSDVVAAGRRAGLTAEEVLADDPTESGSIVTITPLDPLSPSDVALHNSERGFLSIFHGDRVRVAARPSQNNASVISGVHLPQQDESAFLEVDSSGVGRVFKVTATGTSDLFDVNPTANDTYYPANPDALAIGPKGDLAILRTPSGSDPASALDPAYAIVQATPPSQLAPWSELKLADDPACKAEPGGYRASLQTLGPWVRIVNPELRVEDAPMFARVRWSAKRVCLEGFEVRLPTVSVRPLGTSSDAVNVATWLVAKGSTFARVGITEGIEWRQPLDCTVMPKSP